MNFEFFLSNSSSWRFPGKCEGRAFVILLSAILCAFSFGVNCFAQNQGGNGSSSREPFDSFLTGASAETNSRSRTNGTRPPEPKQSLEGLFYPEGFLTSSKPSPDPDEVLAESRRATNTESSAENQQTNAKNEAKVPRFLDPGLETTPYLRPVPPAQEEHRKRGRLYFFAFSIALAALGFFVYSDYRYREQLRRDLERNARLSSPQAVSADFVDFPPGALDAPVQIPQRDSFDSSAYRYASGGGFDSIPITRAVDEDGEKLEANFDFTPQGTGDSDASLEPQEDFVVSTTDE